MWVHARSGVPGVACEDWRWFAGLGCEDEDGWEERALLLLGPLWLLVGTPTVFGTVRFSALCSVFADEFCLSRGRTTRSTRNLRPAWRTLGKAIAFVLGAGLAVHIER